MKTSWHTFYVVQTRWKTEEVASDGTFNYRCSVTPTAGGRHPRRLLLIILYCIFTVSYNKYFLLYPFYVYIFFFVLNVRMFISESTMRLSFTSPFLSSMCHCVANPN